MTINNAAFANLQQELLLRLQKIDEKLQNLEDKAVLTTNAIDRFREETIEIAAEFAEYLERKSSRFSK